MLNSCKGSCMHLEHLGDYHIQRELGEGAFGTVYLAEHQFIRRPFALKVLPKEVCSESSFYRRFEDEVHQIAGLDHPNIVKIHNITCADGFYFLVTDPVVDSFGETMNLERYLQLKGRSLFEEDYLSILQQVASALDYAHSKTMGSAPMIHGALKLTNILVAPQDKGVRILLSDFALTRLIGEGKAFARLCSKMSESLSAETFVNAYAFLAPEQKSMSPQIDPKSDAYAFGTLAYYLLARKTPQGCFDLPSKINPHSHHNWDQLILRCLQPSTIQRPMHLENALEECLKGAPKIDVGDAVSLMQLEPKLESSLQMSFEFQNMRAILALYFSAK